MDSQAVTMALSRWLSAVVHNLHGVFAHSPPAKGRHLDGEFGR